MQPTGCFKKKRNNRKMAYKIQWRGIFTFFWVSEICEWYTRLKLHLQSQRILFIQSVPCVEKNTLPKIHWNFANSCTWPFLKYLSWSGHFNCRAHLSNSILTDVPLRFLEHILIFALAFFVPRNYCFCKMVEFWVKKHKLIKKE